MRSLIFYALSELGAVVASHSSCKYSVLAHTAQFLHGDCGAHGQTELRKSRIAVYRGSAIPARALYCDEACVHKIRFE